MRPSCAQAARLVVETGGEVLDQSQVDQLTQPFRRLGADRTGSDSGTGLGLSIVAAIAEAHGGSVRLTARPEGGLLVAIGLPLARTAAVAGSAGDRVAGLSLGADDYLAKPFHFPELVLRIHALARRQPTARARTLRAAGIELDPLRHTVTRDGRPVDLSVKEFGVLEALLRGQPAFLSAEQLLEQVWDEFADPFTNAVTVTIGRLRRKLGDPPVITTTPGVGYRLTLQPGPGQ